MLLRQPTSTLFPYTTLFRSADRVGRCCGLKCNAANVAIRVVHNRCLVARRVEVSRVRIGGERRESQRSDRKSTRLNSSHLGISYAVFCLKKKIGELIKWLKL